MGTAMRADSLSYKGTVVNGYDAHGGLWFSREVNTKVEFEGAVAEAKALPDVTKIQATF